VRTPSRSSPIGHKNSRDATAQTNVFVDFSGIAPGAHWPETLRQQINGCGAVLGVVGSGWGGAKFPANAGKRSNRPRLDDQDDRVRQELCTAMRRAKNEFDDSA